MNIDNNGLNKLSINSKDYTYAYDRNGNLISETRSRQLAWDYYGPNAFL